MTAIRFDVTYQGESLFGVTASTREGAMETATDRIEHLAMYGLAIPVEGIDVEPRYKLR